MATWQQQQQQWQQIITNQMPSIVVVFGYCCCCCHCRRPVDQSVSKSSGLKCKYAREARESVASLLLLNPLRLAIAQFGLCVNVTSWLPIASTRSTNCPRQYDDAAAVAVDVGLLLLAYAIDTSLLMAYSELLNA